MKPVPNVRVEPDDAVVIALFDGSKLVGTCRRAVRYIVDVYRASRASKIVERVGAITSETNRPRLGMVLITAALVNVVMLMTRGFPEWRLLVIPTIAAAQGMVLIVTSTRRR